MSSDESSNKCEKPISYQDALSYWNHIPPTVDGMLGGFGFISSIDIQGSEQFLKMLFKVSCMLLFMDLSSIRSLPKAMLCLKYFFGYLKPPLRDIKFQHDKKNTHRIVYYFDIVFFIQFIATTIAP